MLSQILPEVGESKASGLGLAKLLIPRFRKVAAIDLSIWAWISKVGTKRMNEHKINMIKLNRLLLRGISPGNSIIFFYLGHKTVFLRGWNFWLLLNFSLSQLRHKLHKLIIIKWETTDTVYLPSPMEPTCPFPSSHVLYCPPIGRYLANGIGLPINIGCEIFAQIQEPSWSSARNEEVNLLNFTLQSTTKNRKVYSNLAGKGFRIIRAPTNYTGPSKQ